VSAPGKAGAIQPVKVHASIPAEAGLALEEIAERRLGPVVVGPSPFFNTQGKLLAAVMVRHALPAIFR
jgi:hypothetical protein